MTEQLINTDTLSQTLVILADKLGMGLQQMYEIYISAQQTMALLQIVFTIATTVGLMVIMFLTFKYYKNHKQDNKYEATELFCLMGGICVSLSFILVMVCLYNASLALICPQYTALHAMILDIHSLL